MKELLLLGLAPLALVTPALAQSHQDMPGMQMPAAQPAPSATAEPASAAEDAPRRGTDLAPGNAPAPPVQHDRAADRFFDPAAMQQAEARLLGEHGGMTYHLLLLNLAEVQAHRGRDGYRWDGEFWIGGDIDRLTIKSEGDGSFGGRAEAAEVQALYSHALDPYWNLQLGGRQDLQPGRKHSYAIAGVEGLAPYWIELGGALFLSDKGDLLGRVDAYYDQRVTQDFVLQPRVELNLAAQDVPGNRIGSGLSNAELGLRLRYEARREFAPYVGISYDRKFGETARFARRDGREAAQTSLVFGMRTWF